MELEATQTSVIPIALLAALIGVFIGWLLTYFVIGRGPSKAELSGKLETAEAELDGYKQNVDQHFSKTSDLFNELTESYVKVYKHLSDGAEQLSGVSDMRNRLTLDDGNDAPVTGDTATNEPGLEKPVIEGSVESAEVAKAEDPAFTVSDEAVEETLTELEVSSVAEAPDLESEFESQIDDLDDTEEIDEAEVLDSVAPKTGKDQSV